jgi:diadenosine tetraphosphate (Ap4A) HIT family hydrolase
MDREFLLDPRLNSGEGFSVVDLKLCKVVLVDNSFFPWVVLVPRKNGIIEVIDLTKQDQQLLMEEIAIISQAMQQLFKPDKLNVAALGNIVPQLHVHVIARYKGDLAWPDPVFGKEKKPYEIQMKEKLVGELRKAIDALTKN